MRSSDTTQTKSRLESSSRHATNLIRIRNNQRKSRAKRKERMEGMERQLRKYESEGMRVSKEIQAAAKLVAEENKKLRARLQSKGMRSQEIDMAIGASGGPSKVEMLEAKLSTPRPYHNDESKTGCSPPQPDTPASKCSLPLMPSTTSLPKSTDMFAGGVENDMSMCSAGPCSPPWASLPGTSSCPAPTPWAQDGCNVLFGSMPQGGVQDYQMGKTAAHEVEQCFGLPHSFQDNTCNVSDAGIYTEDTRQEAVATTGCPVEKNSYPGLGVLGGGSYEQLYGLLDG